MSQVDSGAFFVYARGMTWTEFFRPDLDHRDGDRYWHRNVPLTGGFTLRLEVTSGYGLAFLGMIAYRGEWFDTRWRRTGEANGPGGLAVLGAVAPMFDGIVTEAFRLTGAREFCFGHDSHDLRDAYEKFLMRRGLYAPGPFAYDECAQEFYTSCVWWREYCGD